MKKTHDPTHLLAVASIAALALASGCGTELGRRRHRRRRLVRGSAGLHTARRADAGLDRRHARARSRSSRGPATPRTARTDPTVDWVTPFEKETGCKANVQDVRHLRRGRAADEDR